MVLEAQGFRMLGNVDIPKAAVRIPTCSMPANDLLMRFRKGTVNPIDMCLFRISVYIVLKDRPSISTIFLI